MICFCRLRRRCVFVLALLLLIAWSAGGTVGAQGTADTLKLVKERYAAAAYEDALSSIDAAKAARPDPAVRPELEKYRMLCLLALGRKADAERSMEALVALDPSLGDAQLQASPSIREMYRSVRRRVLPAAVNQMYEAAKAAVLRKSMDEATAGLKQVIALLGDSDLSSADERWKRDLRMLAEGFLALANTPPPQSPALNVAPAAGDKPAATPPAQQAAAPSSATSEPAVDGNSKASPPVVPAVPIHQEVPPWPSELNRFMKERESAIGVLEVSIDEKGRVVDATMRGTIHRVYDALLVRTALSSWQYRPATRGGVPTKSTRRVQIIVNMRQ